MVPRGHWKWSNVKEAQLLEELECKEANFLKLKYDKANLDEVINNQTHLSNLQWDKFGQVLAKFEDLFQGKFSAWNGPNIDIKQKEDATLFHGRPY